MKRQTLLFLAASAAFLSAFGAEVSVDFARETGPVKPVNAVGQPPITSLVQHDMFHYLKDAGIPYSRLHDTYGEYASGVFVDIPNIFRDFDADDDDPASYDFAFTDILIKNLIANGVEPFYRLGVTIENYPHIRAYHIRPPKDPQKWARVCEHVVRHYTKGWANGFNYKITYWEVWNEADINPDPKQSMMWQGTFAEYCRLYEATSKHLKEKHPEIKVGGYASCGFGGALPWEKNPRKKYWYQCNRDFLAYVRDHKCPLDFFSYHSYADIRSVMMEIDAAEKTLAEFGFAGTETWLNEWLPGPSHEKLGTARQAAEIAGMMLAMQNSPLSAACIYDARCNIRNYSPLFNPLTFKPHKAYYAFTAFNELRKCGTAVATTVKGAKDLYAAAAKGGGCAAVVAANASNAAVPLALDVGAWRVLSCRVTDGARTNAEADLPQTLPPWSVLAVRLAPPLEGKPWLIVNEDNDHYFKNPSELMTEKDLAEYVDYICRGPVTHFFMCPSGQRASFDSKTWEPIWKGIGESARPDTATGPNGTRDRWCVNAKLLCDKGIDPYAVWTKRCRERGVSPWMTLRMNDVHHMNNTNYFRNTTFCKTRRDLWLRPDAKGWTDFCLDYAKKDTQDYMMAHLAEVAERYDVDGIELDWMRSGVNLRRGHEREDARCMTAFMRDVRRRLDEIGAKRGRRISLGIRACYDPDLALDRMGMDVAAWAKEGLVDLVVPTGIYFADAGIAVSKWVERIGRANPSVRVIPCIDYCHKQRGKQTWMNMAKFRWVANRFYEQGAAGIYLFNLPYLGKYPTDGKLVPNDVAAEIFTEGLSPETIAGKDQAEIAVFHDFDEADLASYVDPFVGTAGTGHTTPAACVPFGMVQAGPDTGFGDWPHCSGYIYGDKKICGFTQTHLNGTGCPDLGDLRIVPMRSEKLTVNSEQLRRGGLFDKASEVAEPGYYAVTLKEPAVRVEVAAAAHSAIYRFTPMRGLGERGEEGERGELRLLIEPKAMFFNPPEFPEKPTETLAFERTKDAQGSVTGLSGAYRASCWVTREVGYAVEFDREARCVGENVYAFRVKLGEPLTVKVGLAAGGGRTRRSASLPERARRNLAAEIAGWDFDGVKAAARAKWNEVLGVATIEGTQEQKRNWYTALYHLCVQPNNIADVGEKPFYSTFSCWDTFRAAGPLYTILYPDMAAAFVGSMLEQGKRTGHLPIWTLWGHDNQCMIGTHSVPMIVDEFLKESKSEEGKVKECGRIRFWEDAYAQIKETLTRRHEGRKKENWDLYDKYGYYPFDLIRGESVSRTLECAYDDWCAGVMAEKLGHKEDAEFFFKRAGYWKNVFDPSIGFVRGKDSKGNWRTPYDPYALGHGAGTANDFTEGNAFQYSWHMMQDVPGLVAAMGGREKFLKKLDSLFEAPSKTDGMGEVLDVTGLIGQYVHGNEPSHHVIYFYPQVGEPRKAAERIREVFDKFYLPKPDGLCGNDDCGQMSAWYLFSAKGFYPFNPCGGEYVIGAPQVARVEVKARGEGEQRKVFSVVARGLSKENKYVKTVTLNGKPIADWKIRHEDIVAGGELVFEMGK